MKKAAIIPFFLVGLFLLPSCKLKDYYIDARKDYDDISVSNIQEVMDTQRPSQYLYDVDITNTGDEWVSAYLLYQGKYAFYVYDTHSPFYELIIKPRATISVGIAGSEQLNLDDTSLKFKMSSFNEKQRVKTSTTKITVGKYTNNEVNHAYRLNYTPDNLEMTLLVDMTYDGKPYSVMVSGNNIDYTFYTNEKLDLSKLSINSFRAYKRIRNPELQKAYDRLYWSIIILLGIIPGSVVITIVTLAVISHKRKKRQNLEENKD